MPVPSRFGEVPDAFDEWFERACARDVTQRYSTAKEAAASLKFVCGGEPTEILGTAIATGNHPVPARTAVASHPGARTSAGFSSSQLGASSADAKPSSRGLVLGLGVAAVLLVAGGAFAWSRLGTPHTDVATTEPSALGAPTSTAAANGAIAPAPSATEQAATSATPVSSAPEDPAHAAPVVAAAKHHAASVHVAAPAKHVDATPPAAPKATAAAKVNLGI